MDIHALTNPMDHHATDASAVPAVPAPRRRWLTRVLLPLVILLLTGGLFAYAARDAMWPVADVRVVRAVARESGGAGDAAAAPAAATVSVQAPGWVEPDPYPVFVTALTDGVIEKVHVLEGETVEVGQTVAEMVADDARLAAARAEADLARRRAQLQAAKTDWENPVALERAAAVSKAMLAEAQAELAQLEPTIAQQSAKLNELRAAHDRVRTLSASAASKLEVEQAQYQHEGQQALLEATRRQRAVLEAKVRRYEAEAAAAETDLRLRVTLRQALDEAQAAVDEATAARDEANLRLTRMKIVSPVAGVVINRMVSPGAKVMFNMDAPHSAHVVHVYDPAHLQVRVDVPLADAAKVGVGQRARIVVDVLPNREFAGRVTRFVHQADIGKNTVEVKVAIEDPSPLLKPDMLARVKFLVTQDAAGGETAAAASASALTVFAPRSAVLSHGEHKYVWVVTPGNNRLRQQTVTLGGERGDGWVAVLNGLNPGDVLVDQPPAELAEGQRVNAIDETEAAL
jgi:RND family efflux transporter MFP subunit